VLLPSGFASAQEFVVAPLVKGSYSNVMVEADFNGDGVADLGVQGYDPNKRKEVFTVLLGDGDGTFTPSSQVITSQSGEALATGDWDSDGIPDVAIVQPFSDLCIYLGLGDGTFRQGNNYALSVVPQAITVGDMNGDGVPDLITADEVGTVSVFLGQGG